MLGLGAPSRDPASGVQHATRPERERPIDVYGNTHGLKANQVRLLERLPRRRVSPDRLVSHELAREMAGLSREIGRQVGVLVDRRGAPYEAN